MRNRLIELLNRKQDYGVTYAKSQMDDRKTYIAETPNSVIAYYLLENGVIVPPCKIGDTIYVINNLFIIKECTVTRMELDLNSKLVIVFENKDFRNRRYGKTVDYFGIDMFLTKEEAEAKKALILGWGRKEEKENG